MNPTPADDASLRELQTWLLAAITDESQAELADTVAARVVRGSMRMNARARIDVYRDAYAVRLIECLGDDFPALRTLLGPDRFAELCRRYIYAYPPRSPSLNDFGAGLPDFCISAAARAPGCNANDAGAGLTRELAEETSATPELLRDLARIEWAAVELIHAAAAAPLSAAALHAHAATFGAARLRAVPTLRLLRLSHPLHAAYLALRDGVRVAAPIPAADDSFELITRVDFRVHFEAISTPEGLLLSDLLGGFSIAEALERAAERGASEELIGLCFQRWLAAGHFAQLEPPSRPQ